MKKIEELRVRLFCDGADLASIAETASYPWIQGFTTNPTLMRRAGVQDYEAFARALLRAVPDRPVSLEVFADEEAEMEMQALTMATWGPEVNIKIPVTNCAGHFLGPLIQRLALAGVTVNVTAVMTLGQVAAIAAVLPPECDAIVSVFAGRIADTGIDPVPVMRAAKELLRERTRAQLLWASPRELLNLFQADEAGCDIITVPPEMLRKLGLLGKDLAAYSRETVEMFHRDARAAAYAIDTEGVVDRRKDSAKAEQEIDGVGEVAGAVIGAGIGEGVEQRRGVRSGA